MKNLRTFEAYSEYWQELDKFENWYVDAAGEEGLGNEIYGTVIMEGNDDKGRELLRKALEQLFPDEPISDGLVEAALDNVKQIG